MILNCRRTSTGGNGRGGGNIGHPDKPEEVDWFLVMLAKAVPRMTMEESAVLEKWLRTLVKYDVLSDPILPTN